MTDSKIYIVESDASVSGVIGPRHLGLVIVRYNQSTQEYEASVIDGFQSEGFGIPAGKVDVTNQQGLIFGNLIINVSLLTGSLQDITQNLTAINAIKLNIDPLEVGQKADQILNEVISVSSLQTDVDSEGVDREFFDYNTAYNPLGPNSNSVANTLLSAAGIDLRHVVENDGSSEGGDYIGHTAILDSSGNDNFTAFAYNNKSYTFFDADGNDTITVEDGATIKILDTGASGANTLILKGYDPADIILMQIGDNLVVRESGFFGKEIAFVEGHFAAGLTQTTLLQFQDTLGNAIAGEDIDLANLTGANLKFVNRVTPSSFNNNPLGVASAIWDPLIVDLDGDGVLTDMNDGFSNFRHFDLNADGFAESLRWAGGDDGFLVRDINGNGRIDNGSELFGTADTDGFSMLATFDGNTDGLIDANDAVWSDLLIWKDANADGQTQNGEMHALSAHDITSFDVVNVNEINVQFGWHDDRFSHSGVANTSTGTLEVVNANFFTDLTSTRYAGDYDLDPLAAVLPDILGRGTLADLHIAMSLDNDANDPASLLSIAQNIAGYRPIDILTNFSAFKQKIVDLHYRWAGVENNSPTGRGIYMEDGRQLDYLEKYFGGNFIDTTTGSPNPQILQAVELENTWDDLFGKHLLKTILQNGGEEIFGDDLTVSFLEHSVQIQSPFTFDISQNIIDQLEAHAISLTDTAARKAFWLDVADFIHVTEFSIGYTSNNHTGFTIALSTTTEAALNAAVANSDAGLSWQKENHILGGGVESIEYRFFNETGEVIEGDETANSHFVDAIFAGTSFDDTMYGYGGDDILTGGDGNDILYGGDGNDQLAGALGADTLYGEGGNDTLYASSGINHLFNQLYGGNGDDVFYTYTAAGTTFADGGAGNDTFRVQANLPWLTDSGGTNDVVFIELTTANASNLVYERLSDDTLRVTGGASFYVQDHFNNTEVPIEWITFANGDSAFALSTNLGQVKTFGNGASETIYGIEVGGSINDKIFADSGDDVVYSGLGDDEIHGENGDDILYGEDGNDALHGGDGNDIIYGGVSDDVIHGDRGDDTLYGGDGDDILNGASGNNNIFGGDGNDTITATGSATITGGLGNDLIKDGVETLANNPNIDTYLFNVGDGQDTIIFTNATVSGLGDKQDTIKINDVDISEVSFENVGNSVRIHYSPNDFVEVVDHLSGPRSMDTVLFEDNFSLDFGDYDFWTYDGNGGAGPNTIIGSSIDNVINAGNSGDEVYGGGGNDVLSGESGDDKIHGGDGDDVISGGSGNDRLWGGLGNDTLSFALDIAGVDANLLTGSATDGFFGGQDTFTGIENLVGSAFNDTLVGDGNANVFEGDNGNDIINGGGGSDEYIFNVGDGQDTITDSDGATDFVRFGAGITQADLVLTQVTNNLEITFTSGTDKIIIVDHYDVGTTNQIEKAIFDDLSELALTEVIVDNTDASQITITGNWSASSLTIGYGANSLYSSTLGDSVSWNPNLNADGAYEISAQWAAWGNRDSNAVYEVHHVNGVTNVSVDQSDLALSGQWNTLGTFALDQNSFVRIVHDGVGGLTSADAIRFAPGGPLNTLPIAKDDALNAVEDTQLSGVNVIANNGNGADSDPDGGALSVTAETITTVQNGTVVLSANGDFTYTPATGFTGVDSFAYTLLDGNGGSDIGDVSLIVSSALPDTEIIIDNTDASQVTITGSWFVSALTTGYGVNSLYSTTIGDSVSWNPSLSAASGYEISAQWAPSGNRDTSAVYEVHHVNGVTNVSVDQTDMALSGQWNVLGAFTLDQNSYVRIVHDGIGGAFTGADAIRFDNASDDALYGSASSNYLNGGGGNDVISGSGGFDVLVGGPGADTFLFVQAGLDGTIDTIEDLNIAEGDKLDISDLITGYDPLTQAIEEFVQITNNGTNSDLSVDANGGGDNFVQIATLIGVTDLTNEDTLETSGNLITV